MSNLTFKRHPVVLRPGFDCSATGNHCEHAGKPGSNHGIHGDEFIYGVSAELPDGRMAALTLSIFTGRYPATVDRARRYRPGLGYPSGAYLDIHMQLAKDAAPPNEYVNVVEACEWLGGNRRCYSDGSCSMADDLYRAHGNPSDEDDVDLTKQSDSFWQAMERQLVRWTDGR